MLLRCLRNATSDQDLWRCSPNSITNWSSIGAAIASRLDAEGWHIVCVCDAGTCWARGARVLTISITCTNKYGNKIIERFCVRNILVHLSHRSCTYRNNHHEAYGSDLHSHDIIRICATYSSTSTLVMYVLHMCWFRTQAEWVVNIRKSCGQQNLLLRYEVVF